MDFSWDAHSNELYIDGRWTSAVSTERIEVISPSSECGIATVPAAAADDMDRAVGAARSAFDKGDWPQAPLADRIEILSRLQAAILGEQDLLAQVMTAEMGCPISQSRSIQASRPAEILQNAMSLAPTYPFRTVRSSEPATALVTRVPVGVVAAVVPWNMPLAVTMQKLAPALLTGCTVVLKPAPETPVSAYLLAELAHWAGVPPGVLNVVPAEREISEYLVSHPGIDKVAFTGSTRAGRRIAELCGRDLKRCTLELGGKSAAIVLDDADFDDVVSALRMGSFRNSGQVCSLKTRLVVPRRRQAEFLERLTEMVGGLQVGDPAEESTDIGPMVSARQRSVVENYIRIGHQEGAEVVRGGGRPAELKRGWYVEPTIFANVTPDMRIAQEEIFGPVVTVLTYGTDEEAVTIANDSTYGLNGSVFSADVRRAFDVASQLRTGTVEVNGRPAGLQAPMGGFKASGIGREAGLEGFDAYVELKSYGIPSEFASSVR